MNNNGQPTVVIADDNREILKVLARLLEPSHRVVAQAEYGDTAFRAIQAHQPELAILDISMPVMNGLEVARQLRAAHSSTKVVFLTLQTAIEVVDELDAAQMDTSPRCGFTVICTLHWMLRGAVGSS